MQRWSKTEEKISSETGKRQKQAKNWVNWVGNKCPQKGGEKKRILPSPKDQPKKRKKGVPEKGGRRARLI